MSCAPLQNFDCLFLAKENKAKVGYATLAVVALDKLVPLAKEFLAAHYHIEDISGLVTSDGAVSVYHYSHFDTGDRATVLAVAPLDKPVFPSIAAIYQGAEWHERETRDFFGFQYEGNPNFIPLLLPDNLVDVHPLLKDEAALSPLSAMFSAEGREREVVKQADGFTLLDVPVKEEPAPAQTPAEAPKEEVKAEAKPEAGPAPAAEAKTEAPAPAPKEEAKPAPAPEVKPEPQEAPKTPEAPKAAPAAEKQEAPVAPAKPAEPKPEVKPEPKPEAKPEPQAEAPAKAEATPAAKPAPSAPPQKVTASVKKGKVVQNKPGKKGAGK